MKNILLSFIFVTLLSAHTLCIEGGGSKTAVTLLDDMGNTLCQKSLGPTNYLQIGDEGFRHFLRHLPKIENPKEVTVIGAFAGIGREAEKMAVTTLFKEAGFSEERLQLMTDGEICTKIAGDGGVVLIAGTGSIALATSQNSTVRAGGLGRLIDDAGSGYWLGMQAIKCALAEIYGYGKPTQLTAMITSHFELDDLKEIIPLIHQNTIMPRDVASVSKLVFEATCDDIAEELLAAAARELAYLINSVLKQVADPSGTIHLWGGLFKSPHANHFIDMIHDNLKNEWRYPLINCAFEDPTLLYMITMDSCDSVKRVK